MTALDIYRYFQAFKDAYDSFMKPFSVELGIPRAAMIFCCFWLTIRTTTLRARYVRIFT